MSISPPPQDHYKILGVPKDANINTIRSVYRKLVLTTHPDKFQDEAVKAKKVEEFHQVQKAWETLSDDKERERYDALCRLTELKAERFREENLRRKDREATGSREPAFNPRPTPDIRSWTATEHVFEDIRPDNRPDKKRYDEPRTTTLKSPEPRSSPRAETHRFASRDHDDYDDFVPAFGISKKGNSSTARASEPQKEDSSSRARNRFRAGIQKVAAEKAKEREYEGRRRTRDKERRDDGQSKRTYVRTPNEGDYASDMEPEIEAFMGYTFKRGEGRPRSYEDEKHHSRRKHESRGSSPDRESKTHHHVQSAAEYIKKLGGKAASERESKRRPSISRAQSSSRSQAVPPPPPPPPPMPPVEDVMRSSLRKGASKSSKSRRDPIEIVEPRRPSLNTAATAPSPTMLKPPPSRAATLDVRGSDKPKASFRRVATSPLAPSGSTSYSHKASKSRDSHDSGFDSSDAAEILSPRTTKTQYRVQVKGGSDGENGVQPEFELINPDQYRHGRHESSPRSTSYRGDRGPSSLRHGGGPSRSHTLEESSSHRPPPLSRAATDKGSSMLFREIPNRNSPEARESRSRHHDVHHSPQYSKQDINYSPLPRRSSPTEMDSRRDHGDAYSGYERRGSIPLRPVRAQPA